MPPTKSRPPSMLWFLLAAAVAILAYRQMPHVSAPPPSAPPVIPPVIRGDPTAGGAPVTIPAPTPAEFAAAIAAMQEMADQAERAQMAEAKRTFDQAHGFFHAVDTPLRAKDAPLARELWNAVAAMEAQLERPAPDAAQLASGAKQVLRLLQEAQKRFT